MTAFGRFLASIPRPPVATFGAGVVASVMTAGTILAIAILPWPRDVAITRIDALKWLGLAQTFLNLVVIISWAWGRPENFSVRLGGQQVDLAFDDKAQPPKP